MNVHTTIRSKRKEAGLSQIYIAKQLGYQSAQFVSNWERGISMPPLEKSKKLANLLNIPADSYKKLLIARYKQKLDEHFR